MKKHTFRPTIPSPRVTSKNATILLKACGEQDDNLQAVQDIIVNNCHGKVNFTTTFEMICGKTSTAVDGASPLFVAAGSCNLEICKYLIANGADVNALTAKEQIQYGEMTPLRAAMYLIKELPLAKREPVIGLLIANGAKADMYGLTPLNVAAIGCFRQESDYYTNEPIYTTEPVFRYLLHRNNTSHLEKIDALELAGAIILLREVKNRNDVPRALKFWNEAQDIRESAQGSIPKVSLTVKSNVQWRAVEWTTRDHLQELRQSSMAELKVQAMLVSTRILVRISCSSLFYYVWQRYVRDYCSSLYRPGGQPIQQLNICWILLEGARAGHDPGDPDLWQMVGPVTWFLATTLSELKTANSPILNSDILKLSLELVSDTTPVHMAQVTLPHCIGMGNPLYAIYRLVYILSQKPDLMTDEIKGLLRRLIQRDVRNELGCDLLMFAWDLPFDGIDIIIFLLEDGWADPNDADLRGNCALHYCCRHLNSSPRVELLLKYGALIDKINLKGETALDVWKSMMKEKDPFPPLPSWAVYHDTDLFFSVSQIG